MKKYMIQNETSNEYQGQPVDAKESYQNHTQFHIRLVASECDTWTWRIKFSLHFGEGAEKDMFRLGSLKSLDISLIRENQEKMLQFRLSWLA